VAFIAGYISTLVIDGNNVHPYASDATLSLTNETLDKTTLGMSNRQYIPGLQDGSIDMSLHLDTVGIVGIQAAFASTTPVDFTFRLGKLGAGFDAGAWDGTMIITSLDLSGSVDDNHSMNISGQVTGPVPFTQPV